MQRYVERHREVERHGEMQRNERDISHPCVADKNQEGYLEIEGSQPQTRPLSPGFQCQEDKSP